MNLLVRHRRDYRARYHRLPSTPSRQTHLPDTIKNERRKIRFHRKSLLHNLQTVLQLFIQQVFREIIPLLLFKIGLIRAILPMSLPRQHQQIEVLPLQDQFIRHPERVSRMHVVIHLTRNQE